MIKRIQLEELGILDEIVRICNKHNLTYFLIGGTLLGAVRHGGFIPWDDDLDIAMPRHDYNAFIRLCKSELNQAYLLQDQHSEENYWAPFIKIRKKHTIYQEDLPFSVQEMGFWVDIFPLDNSRGRTHLIEKTKRKILVYLSYTIKYKEFNKKDSKLLPNGILGKTAIIITRFVLKKIFCLKDTAILDIYASIAQSQINHPPYLVNHGSKYGVVKQTIPTNKYFPASELMFCGKIYSVPRDYHGVLTSIYGEKYMQLPPEEKRVTHNPVRLSFDTSGPDEVLEDI